MGHSGCKNVDVTLENEDMAQPHTTEIRASLHHKSKTFVVIVREDYLGFFCTHVLRREGMTHQVAVSDSNPEADGQPKNPKV